MDFWTPNSPLGGLAHVKTGRSRRESSWDPHAPHADLPPVDQRLPRRLPEHGLWDE